MSEGTNAPAGGPGGAQNEGQQGGQQSGGTGQGGQAGQQSTGTQLGGQQGGNQQSGGTGQQGGDSQRLEDQPEWVQKLVRDARAEAGNARTQAKATAAQEARDAVLRDLAKAMGLVKDEPVDPAKLAQDLAERDGKLKSTTIQLAVLRAAGKAGGDPDALLDSRTFLTKLESLDPAADGFADQVSAAIAQAVKDNPKLGAGTPIGAGGGELPGATNDPGAGGSGAGMDDVMKRVRANRNRF